MNFNPYRIDFSPQELVQKLDRYIVGQQRLKRDIALTIWNHLNYIADKDSGECVDIEKSNLFIWGPSGTGKTETARKAFEILGMPSAILDITPYTDAGYYGKNVEGLIKEYINKIGDPELARFGVLHLDEIDKKHKNERAGVDVSGVRVQQQLLKLIEGTNVAYGKGKMFDTTDLLFFVSGAFDGIEKVVKSSSKGGSFGFQSKMEVLRKRSPEPTLEDFMTYGMIPEFLRRFGTFSRTEKLTEEDLYNILKLGTCKAKNSVVSNFMRSGIELDFSDEALRRLAYQASHQGIGASGLKVILNGILNDFQYELTEKDINSLVITPEMVDSPESELKTLKDGLEERPQRERKPRLRLDDKTFPQTAEAYYEELLMLGTGEYLAKVTCEHLWKEKIHPNFARDVYWQYNTRIDEIEIDFAFDFQKELKIHPYARAHAISEDISNEYMNVELFFDMTFNFRGHQEEIEASPLETIEIAFEDCADRDNFYKKIQEEDDDE